MLVPRPALRSLARLKLRGYARSVRRRLSRPSGFFFGLLGFGLTVAWIAFFLVRGGRTGAPVDESLRLPLIRGVIATIGMLSIVGSLGFRGVYLPKEELERLLAAPVSRADLVRYRMWMSGGRSLVFALIVGFVFAPRMPRPFLAFPAIFVTAMTLPVVGQAVALVAGDAENRVGRIVRRMPLTLLRVVVALFFWLLVVSFFFWDDVRDVLPGIDPELGPAALFAHPAVSLLTAPLVPWARAIAAGGAGEFALWFAVILVLWAALFEGTARLPVDFRELSLVTSADVARRLRRMRSGRNLITGARVSQRALGWQVPWVLGRGPFGAIAWLKLCAILRKARGTLLFASFVLLLLTSASTLGADLFPGTLTGSAVLGFLATIYLAFGLRFDFRSDLDWMDVIKTWPLAPWRVFLATVLPQALLISLLASTAVVLRAAALGELGPELSAVVVALPFVSLLWLALDNAMFLLVPVRYSPDQGGAMQHTGRGLLLVLLRMLVLGVIGVAVALAIAFTQLVGAHLHWADSMVTLVAAVLASATVLAALAALVAFGGWALRRFDVSRDRPG